MPRGARSGGRRRRTRSGGSRRRPSWHRCAGRRGGGCRIAGTRCGVAPRRGEPRASRDDVRSSPRRRRGLPLGALVAGDGSGATPKPSRSSTPVTSAGTVGAGWDAREPIAPTRRRLEVQGRRRGRCGRADGVDVSGPGAHRQRRRWPRRIRPSRRRAARFRMPLSSRARHRRPESWPPPRRTRGQRRQRRPCPPRRRGRSPPRTPCRRRAPRGRRRRARAQRGRMRCDEDPPRTQRSDRRPSFPAFAALAGFSALAGLAGFSDFDAFAALRSALALRPPRCPRAPGPSSSSSIVVAESGEERVEPGRLLAPGGATVGSSGAAVGSGNGNGGGRAATDGAVGLLGLGGGGGVDDPAPERCRFGGLVGGGIGDAEDGVERGAFRGLRGCRTVGRRAGRGLRGDGLPDRRWTFGRLLRDRGAGGCRRLRVGRLVPGHARCRLRLRRSAAVGCVWIGCGGSAATDTQRPAVSESAAPELGTRESTAPASAAAPTRQRLAAAPEACCA